MATQSRVPGGLWPSEASPSLLHSLHKTIPNQMNKIHVEQAFNPSTTWETVVEEVDFSEFEASLVSTVSSRTAMDEIGKTDCKNQSKANQPTNQPKITTTKPTNQTSTQNPNSKRSQPKFMHFIQMYR